MGNSELTRVSSTEPCAICGRINWCSRSADGSSRSVDYRGAGTGFLQIVVSKGTLKLDLMLRRASKIEPPSPVFAGSRLWDLEHLGLDTDEIWGQLMPSEEEVDSHE